MGFCVEKSHKNLKVPNLALVALIIVLVVAIVGVVAYYNSRVTDLNGQIATLKNQVSSLNSQISSLNAPYLVTALGIHEINNGTFNVGNGEKLNSNALSISGTISNEGKTTAYNVGLQVVALNFYGDTVINMTVPLEGVNGTASVPNGDNLPLTQSIDPIQSQQLLINILCQNDVPTSWTITPVCTSSP